MPSRRVGGRLVNNLNQVRGSVTLSNVKKVIRKNELDITKVDLFKVPVSGMLRGVGPTNTGQDEMRRRAKVRDMSLKIAPRVAEVLLDHSADAVVCFRVDDVPVAVVRVAASGEGKERQKVIRRNIAGFKSKITRAMKEWLA